jgi:hypothetical protein
VKAKQRNHNNSDPGIVNISGDERDLLTSVCHDPFPGRIGVEGDVSERKAIALLMKLMMMN